MLIVITLKGMTKLVIGQLNCNYYYLTLLDLHFFLNSENLEIGKLNDKGNEALALMDVNYKK